MNQYRSPKLHGAITSRYDWVFQAQVKPAPHCHHPDLCVSVNIQYATRPQLRSELSARQSPPVKFVRAPPQVTAVDLSFTSGTIDSFADPAECKVSTCSFTEDQMSRNLGS